MSTSSPSGSEQRNQHKQLDQHSDSQNTDHTTLAQKLRGFLPSWRFVVALLIGTLVGFGALQIATHDERLGQRSVDIAIVDEAQVFDDDLLRSELGDVSWGRHVRMLVYVGEATEDTAVGLCAGDADDCIAKRFPAYFDQEYGFIHADAVVFWLDPEAGAVSIEAKSITNGAWKYLPAFLDSASDYAGHLFATDSLDEATVAAIFQSVADVEAGAANNSGWAWRFEVALVAGLLATFLTWLALTALVQARNAKRARLVHMTRAEHLDIARRVRRDYTQASLNLDEVEMIGVVDAGRYTPTLEARIAQWQLSYAEFARLMFDAHDMSNRELANAENSLLLMQLDRMASNVTGARAHLVADDKAVREGTIEGHPAPRDLALAVDGAAELARRTDNEALGDDVARWTSMISKAQSASVLVALEIWDAVAAELDSKPETAFAAYRIENGEEFPHRARIEGAAQLRSLGTVAAGDLAAPRTALEGGTQQSADELAELADAARRDEQSGVSFRVPISPALIAGSAAISIVLGIVVALTSTNAGVLDASEPYAEIPAELIDDGAGESDILAEWAETREESLRPASSVGIYDDAGLFDDQELLEDALASIGFRSNINLVVITSDSHLPLDRYSSLAETYDEFPEYFPSVGSGEGSIHDQLAPYVVLWIDLAGKESGAVLSSLDLWPPESTFTSRWDPRDEIAQAEKYPNVAVWNAAVAVAHWNRGVGTVLETSTVASGDDVVKRAIGGSLMAFPLVLIAGVVLLKPIRKRRLTKQLFDEMRSTMTALTLAYDALRLEVNYLDQRYRGYDAATRWYTWDADFTQALEVTGMGEHAETARQQWNSLRGESAHAQRLARLNVARTVRAQAESLWRMRAILASEPGWANAWDDEIAHTFAAKADEATAFSNQLVTIGHKLRAGRLSPQKALAELDRVSKTHAGPARLRSLRRAEPLEDSARALAETGVFSIEAHDAVSFGSGARANDLDVSDGEAITRVARADTGAASFQLSISERAMRLMKEQLKKPGLASSLITVVVTVCITLGLWWLANGNPIQRQSWGDWLFLELAEPVGPASVTINDEHNLFDDDRVRDAIESSMLGVKADVYVFSSDQRCESNSLDAHAETLDDFDLVRRNSGIGLAAPMAIHICVAEDSLYEDNGTFIVYDYADGTHLPIRQYNMSTSVTTEPEDFLVSYFESGTGDSPLYTRRYSYQQGVADMIQEISDSQ